MTARGYILIRTHVGRTAEVFRELGKMELVKTIDVITGPYDIIAVLEAPDAESIMHLVMQRTRTIQGVEQTLTCLAVPVNPG